MKYRKPKVCKICGNIGPLRMCICRSCHSLQHDLGRYVNQHSLAVLKPNLSEICKTLKQYEGQEAFIIL